ncbi:MAG: hypothetical protein Q4B81_00235 [Moraxella sp.]|nr:hypothetical protein [Moraxella sp.]
MNLEQRITPHPKAQAGTLKDMSAPLLDELIMSGYSLSDDDVLGVLLSVASILVGWGRIDWQRQDGAGGLLGVDTPITADEWGIMYPLVRAHCDLIQARRMEGVQSLGMTTFNLSASEALSLYNQALETMKRESFCEEPFSIDICEETSLRQRVSVNGSVTVVGRP